MNHRALTALVSTALALLIVPSAAAQTTVVATVGVGAGCDFDDLQAAIDSMAARPETEKVLRLDDSAELVGAFEVSETSLTIAGGFAGCESTAPQSGRTVLRGTAGTVIEIDGGAGTRHTVRLLDLKITGGTAEGNLRGGGVEVRGNVGVVIEGGRIQDNQALLGGGAFIDGSQEAMLTLIDTSINNNFTIDDGDGGGLRCLGARVLAQGGEIALNGAVDGFGGGMSVSGGCEVTVRSPYRVVSNVARNGGGIDAVGNGTRVELLGSGEDFRVEGNLAQSFSGQTVGGGALVDSGATLVALNLRLDRNHAAGSVGIGGGLAVRGGSHVRVARTVGDACPIPDRCATLSDNQATEGAAFSVGEDSSIELVGIRVERNLGEGSVVELFDGSSAELESVAMAHNEAEALAVITESSWRSGFLTVADNELTGPLVQVFNDGSSVELYSSILFEPGNDLLAAEPGNSFALDCLLLNELVTPPAGRLLFTGLPRFVDGTNSDYRLGADSDAIDVCDDVVYAPRAFDIRFLTRGADDPAVPDQAGSFDLGANERGGNEGLFFDGFETGDTSAWTASTP